MEEQILKILNIHIPDCVIYTTNKTRAKDAAKEIESHVMEFILWLSLNAFIATSYSPMYYLYSGIGENRHIDFTKENHITDIYQFWLTNIKNKQP